MTRLQSDRRHHIKFMLNGSAAHGEAEPRMLLTDFLRSVFSFPQRALAISAYRQRLRNP